jgi:hypothetical protein
MRPGEADEEAATPDGVGVGVEAGGDADVEGPEAVEGVVWAAPQPPAARTTASIGMARRMTFRHRLTRARGA